MAARTQPGNKRQATPLPPVAMEYDDELNQTVEIPQPATKKTSPPLRQKATVRRPVSVANDVFTFTDAVSDKAPYKYLDLTSKTVFPNMFLRSCFSPSKQQLATIVGHVILSGEVVDELCWAKKHSETGVPYPYVVAVTNKRTKSGSVICYAMYPWLDQSEADYESAVSRDKKKRLTGEAATAAVEDAVTEDASEFGF